MSTEINIDSNKEVQVKNDGMTNPAIDFILSLFIFAVAAVSLYVINSFEIRTDFIKSSAVFPLFLVVIFCISATVLIVSSIRRGAIGLLRGMLKGINNIFQTKQSQREGITSHLILLVSTFIYLLLIRPMGYYPSTIIFTTFLLWLYWAKKNYPPVKAILFPLLISTVISVGLGYVFVNFFRILLPGS